MHDLRTPVSECSIVRDAQLCILQSEHMEQRQIWRIPDQFIWSRGRFPPPPPAFLHSDADLAEMPLQKCQILGQSPAAARKYAILGPHTHYGVLLHILPIFLQSSSGHKTLGEEGSHL